MLKRKYILFCLSLFALVSCKYTKHIPEDRYLLWDQDVYENGDQNPEGKAESILKQQPNQKFLGIMPNVAIYNWGDGTDTSFWGKLGEAPVVFDSLKAKKAAEQIQFYYFNKGYFSATSEYDVEFKEKKRWAEVHFRVKTGERFYLNDYSVQVKTEKVESLINHFSDESLIKVGEPYSADLLDAERTRLTEMLKNHGFYDFTKSYINFEADSTIGNYKVDVKMIVGQKPVTINDTVKYVDHKQYRFDKIFIQPDYNYKRKQEPPSDTLKYREYYITYDTLEYKPRYFTDAIHFKPGDIYELKSVKETYAHLVGYQAFKITEIRTVESETKTDSAGPTINAIIHTTPLDKRTLLFEPELTTTNGYGGVNMGVTWINRNIFGAGEALEVNLNGGLDYQPTVGGGDRSSRTLEFGGEVGIRFPRFLLPFNTVGLLPKRMRPTSRVSVSANRTTRNEFDRETFGAKLSYSWNETRLKSYTVDLYDLSYSRLFSIDETFRDNLSTFQNRSFQSEFVTASRLSFTYNGQLDSDIKNPSFFRGVFEVAGTSFYLGKSLSTGSFDNEDQGLYRIGNAPYYQHVRAEADYRHRWQLSKNVVWANRAYAGYVLPFGTSIIDSNGVTYRQPAFSKFFFMGGSNDLRAWPAYRLGAGSQGNTNYSTGEDTSFAIGTVKFLASTELRFPIYGFFEGAVFFDAGNTFFTGGVERLPENEGTALNLNTFLQNMAIGTGYGLRLNLDYFVLRADIGIKVYDPGLLSTPQNPWVIRGVAWRPFNWTYNIALGYPF